MEYLDVSQLLDVGPFHEAPIYNEDMYVAPLNYDSALYYYGAGDDPLFINEEEDSAVLPIAEYIADGGNPTTDDIIQTGALQKEEDFFQNLYTTRNTNPTNTIDDAATFLVDNDQSTAIDMNQYISDMAASPLTTVDVKHKLLDYYKQ